MDQRTYIEGRLADAQMELARRLRDAERLSWARLLYAVAAVALLVWWRLDSWPWILAALVPFVLLVRIHRQAEGRVDVARGVVAAASGSRARMDRNWADFPPLQSVDLDGMANVAAVRDLDVYGERSLFRLMDVSQPALGGTTLMRWLLDDPAPLTTIRDRQASVRALRERPDYLLESARLCRHGARPTLGPRRLAVFREWCEQPPTFFSPAAVILARILTGAFVITVIAMIAVPASRDGLARIAVLLIGGQLGVGAAARRHLRATSRGVADMLPDLGDLRDVLRAAVAQPPADGRFGEIQRELASGGATPAFDALARLIDWNTVHYSPMQNAFANAALAFDAHLASRIDRWRAGFGSRIGPWLELAAEAQALTALATLAYENPGWTMPEVHDDEAPVAHATECGHPLIAGTVRITNPVGLEKPGNVVVISGSNMSGKTTYLRAVGLNALLALAGGAVCATALSIRRCRVRTSVRIEDDLSANVSLFMAEVRRIRDVVADAEMEQVAPVLFLFDEILHGTNAQDRREATRLVLRRLIKAGGAGVITTHDPTIGDLTEDSSVAHAHFTDSVTSAGEGVTMTFDYVMRPGAATTTNALRVFAALGLSS